MREPVGQRDPEPKRTRLRAFVDDDGHFWLEQNADKRSDWARLARKRHEIAWEFD